MTVARLSREEYEALVSRLAEDEIVCRSVDGAQLKDEGELLGAIALAFDFPGYFGGNWDALLDCLSDMSWAPAKGYVLVLLNSGVFCDVGHVHRRSAISGERAADSASSTGVGLHYQWRGQIAATIHYAHVLHAPSDAGAGRDRVHASVAMRF